MAAGASQWRQTPSFRPIASGSGVGHSSGDGESKLTMGCAMADLITPGLAMMAVNAGLAFGLVMCGRTRQTPVRDRARYFKFPELISAIVCLALAAFNFAIAAGPGRQMTIVAGLAAVPAVDFYVSALCYALCGGALVLAALPARPAHRGRGAAGR